MMALGILTVLFLAGLVAWGLWRWRRSRKIADLYARPLPDFAVAILKRNVPLYNRLPPELRARLHGHINYFLHDKAFVGCNGMAISDEIRLTIAANACLLVLNRTDRIYPDFTTILVYPDTYVAEEVDYDGLVETRGHSIRLGESWHRGPVVLSWSDVMAGCADPDDGFNVVIHEFAHKLDEENAVMDGLPVLRDRRQYAEWAKVLSREFAAFQQRVKDEENDVIDDYGAVSAAEFFAVICETFFENSREMRRELPELYRQLENFFQLNPAAWREESCERPPPPPTS